MIEVDPGQREALRPFFRPDRAGPNSGLHAIQTGRGALFVDRREDPRVVAARVGVDHQLRGDPARVSPDELREIGLTGLVDAPSAFVPVLRQAFPELFEWSRIIQTLEPVGPGSPVDAEIRLLRPGDELALSALDEDIQWIWEPFDSARGLCESGFAYGAFERDRLLSVANAFNQAERYEDLGVVTEEDARGRGLSTACAARVARDVLARGRIPSWSTSPQNAGSLAVARKLGAVHDRDDVLYVIDFDIG